MPAPEVSELAYPCLRCGEREGDATDDSQLCQPCVERENDRAYESCKERTDD